MLLVPVTQENSEQNVSTRMLIIGFKCFRNREIYVLVSSPNSYNNVSCTVVRHLHRNATEGAREDRFAHILLAERQSKPLW